ncbi:MAG: phage tail protein [Plesiomonas sp.]|uniref:phage tail protein n=1 Tax=Plesiomonas sp. TaxID=2486279 RepID=UPI003F337330
MAAKYFAILTNLGAAKLANATALGTQLEITHMAVGDGGGSLPIPDPAQTALKGERRRAAINLLTVDPLNQNQIITEQVIPETVGGWWIREAGLFDKDGTLVAIANCPETYKPQLQEGSGRTQVVRVILIVSNAESVSLKIDPSVVLATRKYVDDNIIEVKAYADNLLAAHINGDPHTQYAPKASPTFTGTPVAPTPVKADNTTKLATTAFVKTVTADYAPLNSPALTGKPTTPTPAASANDTSIANAAFVKSAIAALVGSSPEALDTLNELATALGNDPNFSTTMINALAGKLSKDQNGADIPDKERFLQNLHLREAANGTSSLIRIPAFINGAKGEYVIQIQQLVSSTTSGLIVFPEAFNNKCMIILPVDYAAAAADNSNVRFNIPTRTQCEWMGQTLSTPSLPVSPSTWAYIAIGF